MKRSKFIDNIQLSEDKGSLHLYIAGWYAVRNTDEHTFQLRVNGKEEKNEIKRCNRFDISRDNALSTGKNIGFVLKSEIADYEKVKTVELDIINKGIRTKLLVMSKKNLKNIISENILKYNIDQVTVSENKIKIIGWAVSTKGEIDFSFATKGGEMLAFEKKSINRADLHMRGFIEDHNAELGFEICLNETNQPLIMTFETKGFSKSVDVFKTLKKQVKAHKIDNIIKLIKIISIKKILHLIGVAIKYGKSELREEAYAMITGGKESQVLTYEKWFEKNKVTKKALAKQSAEKFSFCPMVSIIVPTYNTPIKFLKEMIDSVVAQSYTNWQLCIADGSAGNKKLEAVLKEYNNKDKRIKYEILEKNEGIAGNTNAALALADGDIIGLLDHDDTLEPDALYEVIKCFQDSDVDAVYTDEDKILGPDWKNVEPHFKPDFNLDLLRSNNYITHFFCVKKSIISQVGGFKVRYDGAQDYDIILRCYELSNKVAHVARILYHWRMHADSTAANPESKSYCHVAGQRAIEDHLERVGVKGEVIMSKVFCTYRVKYERTGNPLVSIIIPSKDHIDDLKKCIDSVQERSTYRNLEFIIVENNSTEEETFEYYKQVQNQYDNVKVITWDKAFNYSAINNYGVTHSNGEYILLLNNDTEIINPESIEDMLAMCMRKEVGIVGSKLFYEDDTVQHAGVILGFGGVAGHAGVGISKDDPGYFARAFLNCDFSAVTAACLMISREIYDEVGGLEEAYAVAFNDIDFCMKVREKGYLIVYDAFSQWYHYESKSRGLDDTAEKMERFRDEVNRFEKRWKKELEAGDPYYNKNLSLSSTVYCIDITE